MKLYTRKGDTGETDLLGSERLPKDDSRLEAIGTIDELNTFVGSVLSLGPSREISDILCRVQNELFVLGSNLALTAAESLPCIPLLTDEHIYQIESEIDNLSKSLLPLAAFILPGGTPTASALHVARTVCRRAERRIVTLSRESQLSPIAINYLNRLSDLLFAMARYENRQTGQTEITWQKS